MSVGMFFLTLLKSILVGIITFLLSTKFTTFLLHERLALMIVVTGLYTTIDIIFDLFFKIHYGTCEILCGHSKRKSKKTRRAPKPSQPLKKEEVVVSGY